MSFLLYTYLFADDCDIVNINNLQYGENIMRRFTALLLSLVMLFSLVACGDTQRGNTNKDEVVALLDYTIPRHIKAEMPEEINTVEDMRMAWQSVINCFFDNGVQYNGIPVASMTKGYARQELTKDGYEVTDWNLREIWASKDGHKISVQENAKNTVTDFDVQFFDLGEADCDWNAVADVNSKVTIGDVQNIFGKTFKEMFEQLGVSDLMLAYVKMIGGQFSWYDDNNSYFGIIFEEGLDGQNKYDISISLSRRENGHDQSLHLFNTEEYVSTAYYIESFYDKESADSIARHADVWRMKNNLMSKVWYSDAGGYIIFDDGDVAEARIPELSGDKLYVRWQYMKQEATDAGQDYVCDFEVRDANDKWTNLDLRIDAETETLTLYNSDNQEISVFTH